MALPTAPSEITRPIAACGERDSRAHGSRFSPVYDDLRPIGHRQLRSEAEGHALSTTVSVRAVYLDLVDQTHSGWRDRAHFFAVASRAIRDILINAARCRHAAKRGGAAIRIPLRPATASVPAEVVDFLALDEALMRLTKLDERVARVVECRFFAGMTAEETAEKLGCSLRTVERLWTRATAHLYQLLRTEAS